MRNDYYEWDDLGHRIEDIVDNAVRSLDFHELNKTIRQAVDMGTQAVRAAKQNYDRMNESREPLPQPKDMSIYYGSTGGATSAGVLKIVGGGILGGMSLAMWICALVFSFLGWPNVPLLFVCGVGSMGCGIVLIDSGAKKLASVKRFKRYCKILADKNHCALERLAQATGKSVKFVRKELLGMIEEGLFLEGHLDKEQRYLITSYETYQEFEKNRLLLEERQKVTAQPPKPQADFQIQDILRRGNAFIAEIRRCNDIIPGEAVSAKIDRTEQVVRQIFRRAEEHPEVADDLKKLMDYYLPMTVKLLNAYADMDAQTVQGATIAASKKEIEDTLDTLNLAFEKLLDDLFKDTAMDVSSDISVLHTLLAQEGLTEDGFDKLRKETTL